MPTEEQALKREIIGDADPADVTWLTSKVVMFHKHHVSHQRNSTVHLGRQEITRGVFRDVAIKIIRYNENDLREIQLLSKLSHPNIVQIYEAGEFVEKLGHWMYIVMELCGVNLDEYVNKNPANPKKARQFFKQIVSAVHFMHQQNIAHRDIKPSNILISKCGNYIKISDFGISKELPNGVTSATTTSNGAGTEGYKPPEVYNPNYKVSLRSDIFSLGLVVAYILSHGSHPFGDDQFDWSYKIRKNHKIDLSQIPDATPERQQLIRLIEHMLQHAPSDRPTAQDVLNEITCSGDASSRKNAVEEREWAVKDSNQSIVLFDDLSKHLHRVNLHNKSMTKMTTFPDGIASFTAVRLEQYIYIFSWGDRALYRLDCRDVTATWERMHDWPKGHGNSAPVVASPNAIYLVGGSRLTPKSTVSKYIFSTDSWMRLKDKPTVSKWSLLLCNEEFLFCLGGSDEYDRYPIRRVERMDLKTIKWSRIADMNRKGFLKCAAECRGKIYVFYDEDGFSKRVFAESWDPRVNQWTEISVDDPGHSVSRVLTPHGRSVIVAAVIDERLYLVGRGAILEYDVESNILRSCMSYSGLDILDAVLMPNR